MSRRARRLRAYLPKALRQTIVGGMQRRYSVGTATKTGCCLRMSQQGDIVSGHKHDDTEEWRALIDRLSHGQEPALPPEELVPSFDNPMVRKRVGVVITRAVLGEPLYQLYQLYCGDPWPL